MLKPRSIRAGCHSRPGDWFPGDYFDRIRHQFREDPPACTAPSPARSKSPSSRTSCRNARRPNGASISGPTPSSSPIPARRPCSCKTRHWIITDASGRKQEVRGEGVVGEQPVLAPGRALRIHQRRAAADRLGLHDRPLPDGERERRAVRDRRADLFARQSRQQAGVELGIVFSPAGGRRRCGAVSVPRPYSTPASCGVNS